MKARDHFIRAFGISFLIGMAIFFGIISLLLLWYRFMT